MSHLVCPLCGLSVPLSTFWSYIELDVDDIEAVSFRGLGKGKGFEKTEAFSVLEDKEICDAVAQRCHGILDMLGEGVEDYSPLLARISDALSEVYEEEFNDLEEAVETLITEYNEAVEEASDED